MPIYEITEPSGTRRLRVATSVGGKLMQKYFTLGKSISEKEYSQIWDKAEKLNSKWVQLSKEQSEKSKKLAIPFRKAPTPRITSVKGVLMLYVKNGKSYKPVFQVNVKEGRKQVAIKSHGHKKAWNIAIDAICSFKSIDQQSKNKLLGRIPPKSKWHDVRQHYINLGWDIPELSIN